MRFKGEPNLLVTVRKPRFGEPKAFRFDNNGIYETDKPTMIKRISALYKAADEPLHRCKKCDFETDNKGVYLAHCRKEHPKEN